MTDVAWPQNVTGNGHPEWYAACFRSALRRVAITINAVGSSSWKSLDLTLSDDEISERFERGGWDKALIAFHVMARDAHTEDDDEYQAENFFYCDVDFRSRSRVRVANFKVPAPFLDWGYRRLHPPAGTPEELGLHAFGGDATSPAFVRHCATNYLVKNFWHNFTHRVLQGITTDNYHQFRGLAREDSDFEADHVANLLLLRSYGLSVHTSGRSQPMTQLARRAVFARNRCNRIFAERARFRRDDRASMSPAERWEELEWRFCRRTSNAISTTLLVGGLATPSVRVFLGGIAESSATSGRFWRTGEVIVEIGGCRFNTGVKPYIPDDELRAPGPTAKRLADMRRTSEEREASIVAVAVNAYRGRLTTDRALRDGAEKAMEALWTRLGIPI